MSKEESPFVNKTKSKIDIHSVVSATTTTSTSTSTSTSHHPNKRESPTSDPSTSKRQRTKTTITANDENNEIDVIMTEATKTAWGEWMGSWKVGTDDIDQEAERIDRQKAAFGGDTISRLKDLNVLIVGCQGVGVETAKNLILSNVGGVLVWDPTICQMEDRGSNFYITDDHVADGTTTRAQASITELRSLNPFCRVEVHDDDEGSGSITDEFLTSNNILGTQRPLAAVVVTQLLPQQDMFRINEICRANHIAFILALNNGVTSTLFSDFGPTHEIMDATGEPTQTLAVSNMEVFETVDENLLKIQGLKKDQPVIIVTVAQAEHGLDDGDIVTLDDMRDDLEHWNGKQLKVKRVAMASPNEAKLDTNGVAFKEALKLPTSSVIQTFGRQYEYYKKQHEESENNEKKFQVRSITMFNRLAFVLDDEDSESTQKIQAFKTYQAGGLLNQIRPPIQASYKSFQETLEQTPVPQMLRGEEWENGHGIEIHLSIAAVLDFYDAKGRWPGIHNQDDAKKVVELAQAISDARAEQNEKSEEDATYCWSQKVEWAFPSGEKRDLDTKKIELYSRLFGTELTGFCAFLGGAAAQEVLKKSGKFTPINQWVHHDEPSLVVDECASNYAPTFGSRYDYQIAIMGKDFQAQAANQRVFLVGCGALGCEYLKGLALMGVGTGRDGKITVTDMDRIEVSNLSRQFLFRQDDVGHPKSVRGALAVKKWNPSLNIEALERKVGDDTEDFFNDTFWESLHVCWNALDNVMARQYTDARCLFFSKPLLESGTLGTKCNHEVVLPYRTSSYNDGNEDDNNEQQIAMCTLRSFPYLPIHCMEFAKQSYFSDYFEFGPDQYETFRKDKTTFFEQLDSMGGDEQYRSLRMIQSFLEMQKDPSVHIDFTLCVRVAFERMIADYRTSILNLCHSADVMEKSSGKKFWTGTKRRPRPVDWTGATTSSTDLMEYLYATAGLYASVWNVEPVRDRSAFETLVQELNLVQPEWEPPSQNVNLSEGDDDNEGGDESEKVEKLKTDLYSVDVSNLQPALPQDFEKDDDLNFHIDFLTVATNMRSWNYDIKASPRHTVKVTAGRIIPALATTTAMVCGLVDIEFCKLVLGLQSQGRDKFLNSNINLAAGSSNFTTFSPDPPVPIKTGLKSPQPETFTSWDKIEVVAPSAAEEMTVEQLVLHVEKLFGVSVDRVFQYGSTEDKAMYNALDKQKLDWDIVIDEDGKATASDGVFTQWPQLRMAVQMLGRLPPASGQRKIFLGQVERIKKSLDQTKEMFLGNFQGPLSKAYRSSYRPEEDEDEGNEKQQYFDAVLESRNYVVIGVHCNNADGEDITLPPIKYVFPS